METERVAAVRIASLGEARGDEVAALMGRAFQDDPLFVHACPDPGDRARWLPCMFRWSTWQGFLFGETLGTVDPLDGVVALIAPGGGEFTDEDLDRFGYRQGRAVVGAEVWDQATDRVNAAFAPADAALHRAVPEPHWYLDVIAVEPKRQGQGIGSTLLRAASDRADEDDVPIVLLTYQPANLPLYRRHGYTVVCEGAVAEHTLPWWGLRRDPGT